MVTRFYFNLALCAAAAAWGQANPTAIDVSNNSPASESLMQAPPPVSGEGYQTSFTTEARANYLRLGLVVNSAYSDNIFVGSGTKPVADAIYTIWPTMSFDHTTPRQRQTFSYSPGFTFYQHTSELNEQDQNLAWDFRYRLTPHVTASVQDNFRKTSDIFSQPYSLTGGSVSGSTQSTIVPVVAPTAEQLNNTANVGFTYQFGKNGMVGGSGVFTYLHFPNPSEAVGLADSNTRSGSFFYNYRLSETQYLGATYQYSQNSSSLPGTQGTEIQIKSDTQTDAILFFYSIFLTPHLSFSVSGGPQHFEVSETSSPTVASWSPFITGGVGWRGTRTSFAASYQREVSGGGGLIGAFHSDSANVSARWRAASSWTLGAAASYTKTVNVGSFMLESNPGGRMVYGTVTADHPLTNRLNIEFGYTRLHQSYETITAISSAPNANRGYIALTYQLARPLGR